MEILIPAVAPHLRISQVMWEDFLCDPVLAARVIFKVRLDDFQAARLRYYWWIQNLIDSSGVGSGKTVVDFIFANLRALLLPEKQDVAVFYPAFGTGKNSFWTYYTDFALRGNAPIFAAQLGHPLKTEPGEEIAGDGTLHGPDCYTAFYRNGNKVMMPAPSIVLDSVRAASLTVNTLIIEEWAQIDAASDAIDKQLIDRARGGNWNQFHPIWGNHILYTAHAQKKMHPSAARFRSHQRKCDGGDPTYANITFSYKDFSNKLCHTGKSFRDQYRQEIAINNKRAVVSAADWLGQGFGIWGAEGTGWFTEASILNCQAAGAVRELLPVTSRAQFEQSLEARQN